MKIERDEIPAVLHQFLKDPDVRGALERLLYGIATSTSASSEDLAWDFFKDRIQYLISRAHSDAIKQSQTIPGDQL